MRAPALVKSNEPSFVPEFNIDEHSFCMEPEIDVATLIRLKNREAVQPTDKEVCVCRFSLSVLLLTL